jgi:hypothetical protein
MSSHSPHPSPHPIQPPASRLGLAALCLALLLAACEPAATPLARTATLRDVVNVVRARGLASEEFTAINEGYVVAPGGEVQTDTDGRVKLVLNDGILLRLAPSTLLGNDSPETRWAFRLESGKVWASLFGGALTLNTRLGSVVVFGNSVEFEFHVGDSANMADDIFIIQCLQGTCRFQDGRSDIELGDLEQLLITDNGNIVNRLQLSTVQLDEFIANNPETAGILAGLKLSAPRITTTAVAVQVPTIEFFSLSTTEAGAAGGGSAPSLTPTRRAPPLFFPTATPTSTPSPVTAQNTQPAGGALPSLTPVRPTNTLIPPTNTPIPPTSTPPPTRTELPTKTPVIPTKTPVPPTNTPVPPTNTNTPVPPTATDTPVPPPTDTDTPIPPQIDTDTPGPQPPSATP